MISFNMVSYCPIHHTANQRGPKPLQTTFWSRQLGIFKYIFISTHFSFDGNISQYITKVFCYLQFLYVRLWADGYTERAAGSATSMTPMSPGHMDQIGSWTTWMAYMVTSNSLRRFRKKSTYLFSTMTSTGDHNLYQKPTHTHLYQNRESHHYPSNIQAIFSILM